MTAKSRRWTGLHGLTTICLIAVALYFVFVEHGHHTLPYFPYLVILLCPLMHLFMHKGHGGHDHGENRPDDAEEAYKRGLEEGRKQTSTRER